LILHFLKQRKARLVSRTSYFCETSCLVQNSPHWTPLVKAVTIKISQTLDYCSAKFVDFLQFSSNLVENLFEISWAPEKIRKKLPNFGFCSFYSELGVPVRRIWRKSLLYSTKKYRTQRLWVFFLIFSELRRSQLIFLPSCRKSETINNCTFPIFINRYPNLSPYLSI
jgi:hypothetical protein